MGIEQRYNHVVEAMLDYVETGRTDQAVSTLRIPARSYTDAARWEREMELIFLRVPLLVALSAELPAPGDFKTLEILGKPLLITRLADGGVRAMLNVCKHRGMLLADQPCGNRRQFTCRYHAWSYGNDGSLRGVSDPQKFGEVDKATLGLTQLPVYERAGLVFAVLTPGLPTDFESFFGGMLEDLDRIGLAGWHYCGKRELSGANWKIAYDGYLEGYHFAAAHPQTIAPRTFSNVMHFEAHGPHMVVGFPQRGIAKLRGVPREELWRHECDGFDFVRTLFPNVSVFVAPEITQVSLLLPGPRPDQNRTILLFLQRTAPANEAEAAQTTQMMDFLHRVVDEEDYKVGLEVQRGLESGAMDAVIFGRNERGNQYFHRWVDWYLADDPDAPVPAL